MATRLRRMDNAKFENLYSEADALQYGRVGSMPWEKIEPFLNRLPPREIDLLTLYRKYGKNQKDIARIFSVTQGAISSRLKRAGERLQFLRDLPKISDDEIERGLSRIFPPAPQSRYSIEIEIIKFMKETTCQSKTAELMNEKFGYKCEKPVNGNPCCKCESCKDRMTQVKVRHRFEKCINQLKQKPEYSKFYHLLVFINKNLYKLHEVVLPHFNRSSKAVFSLKN